jgi:serine O-acetyltransferase
MSLGDDLRAALDRDPAATNPIEVVLTYPGLHALLVHRLAHYLYVIGIPILPRVVSHVSRMLTGIEIHPGATIGRGLFIDHGMGVVVGETSEIGDNVTMYQGVTLGGTGQERGKRHPTIGDNVMIGVGAKILGAITVGENSKIGAGAVVLNDVPPNSTAVGVPAKVVTFHVPDGSSRRVEYLPDPEADMISNLHQKVSELDERLKELEAELRNTTRSLRRTRAESRSTATARSCST